MINFDFHNLLFPIEFENFCRDVLEIREPNVKFTTYKKGKDGGIDIKSTNSQLKIIGQCKLYHPQNYSGLLSSLKREVTKCNRQKPDRYLICTNIELSPSRAEEIKKLFGNFIINEEDIIDGIKLNKYLGQKKYEYLFKTYSKLLVPNLSSIELALEKVINKKYYNKTKTFLNDIGTRHKLFHSTEQLPYLIQKLEDNRVIILSGNPGVGKTTTAMMIANYFLARKNCDVLYLEERDYPETLSLAEENRLIIVDDFWGQNFSPSIQQHSTFQRELQSIIKYFIHSSNSYLVLVSRDYVIKDALANAEYETEALINQSKYIIDIKAFSFEDKLRIFLNHLLFYEYDLSYISTIKYDDGFEHLLNHPNYSPRHLDFFIKTYLHQEHQSSYDFYSSLRDYLDKPLAFWKDAFGKLNPTAQLILLILLVSSDPMGLKDLKCTFDSVQMEARLVSNAAIVPADFRKELIKLEEFYISIDQDRYYDVSLVEFQSPGIKDYLLEFLRTDGCFWIKPIILNALFFNQLTFIFGTDDEEEISDHESDINLYGKKIKLDDGLIKLLKQKLISGFDILQFSNYEERDFSDQLTRFDTNKDTKYLKLLEVDRLFDIKLPEHDDIRSFIVGQVLTDFREYQQHGGKIVSHRSMMYFPHIVHLVHAYLGLKADDIIKVYDSSITFASEYEYFYKFNKTFPSEFRQFYDTNLQQIKKRIKELLFDEIDYYLWEEEDDDEYGKIGIELDTFLNVTIEELIKIYKMRVTKNLVRELESTFDINFSFLLKGKKPATSRASKSKQKQPRKKYKPKSYASIVDEYLPPDEDSYNPLDFLNEHQLHQYIKEIKNDSSVLSQFKQNRYLFEDACHFFVDSHVQINDSDTYHLIDLYFENHSQKIQADVQDLTNLYYQITNELEQSNQYSITGPKLSLLVRNSNLAVLAIESLAPIIIPYKNWYKFSASVFETYFLAKHIFAVTDNNQFKEEIINVNIDPDDNHFFEFLQLIDRKRLWDFYIIPELNRLIGEIDFTDQKSMALSFVDFFKIEFELDWDQKERSFDTWGSSCSEAHFEGIFPLCSVGFYPSDFEIYFEEAYQTEDAIKRLNINTKVVKALVQAVRKTISTQDYYPDWLDEPAKVYEIKLADFLQSENNYQIACEIGMITYIARVIGKIKNVIVNH